VPAHLPAGKRGNPLPMNQKLPATKLRNNFKLKLQKKYAHELVANAGYMAKMTSISTSQIRALSTKSVDKPRARVDKAANRGVTKVAQITGTGRDRGIMTIPTIGAGKPSVRGP